MTGLQHLIAFLNERHVLSPQELAILERRGLWSRTVGYSDFEQPELPETPEQLALRDDWLYELEVPVRRKKRKRRRWVRRTVPGVAVSVTPGQPSQPR